MKVTRVLENEAFEGLKREISPAAHDDELMRNLRREL